MEIILPRRKYVVAVSGGVDSMVLLDLLSKKPNLELTVAHFNHGIRPDATQDEKLVRKTAKQHGLSLAVGRAKLGARASEAAARKARYNFLEKQRLKQGAGAIITAHHRDDLLETALLNLLRGTGWRGLSSITDNQQLRRPLLAYSKKDILSYARQQDLVWREDSTNQDTDYLRNYLRHKVVPTLTVEQHRSLLKNIDNVAKNKAELDRLIATISQNIVHNGLIDRQAFSSLPLSISHEVMAYWLRDRGVRQFDRPTIDRLTVAVKAAPNGTRQSVRKGLELAVDNTAARFEAI